MDAEAATYSPIHEYKILIDDKHTSWMIRLVPKEV